MRLLETSDGGRSWRAGSGRFRQVDERARTATAGTALTSPAAGEAIRLLLQVVGPNVAWRAEGLALTNRASALSVDVRADGVAWVLLQGGHCSGGPGTCEQDTRLLATDDGGRTLFDITPPASPDTAGASGASRVTPAGVDVSQNKGFDKCTAASVADLRTWWTASPYRDVNIYIGGVSRGCSQPLLTPQWVSEVFDQGWRLIPTWVGPQAPCTGCTTCRNRFSSDPGQAELEGAREADNAAGVASGLGLGVRTVVYFDLENYDWNNRACGQAASAFVNGWSRRMRERGHVPGVYGSATNALQDWFNIASPPDAVWIGKWDGRETVWGLTPLPDSWWANHQRIHQYRGGHNETWGGVTFNIDNNVEDGPLAVRDGVGVVDSAGPDLVVASPRPDQTLDAALLVVSGTASDAGRGDSGISSVTVNNERAAGDTAPGGNLASWSLTVAIARGRNTITVVARDDSPARNETTVTLAVVFEPGPPPPGPPPAPPPPALSLETSSPLPDGHLGEAYQRTFEARGGVPVLVGRCERRSARRARPRGRHGQSERDPGAGGGGPIHRACDRRGERVGRARVRVAHPAGRTDRPRRVGRGAERPARPRGR